MLIYPYNEGVKLPLLVRMEKEKQHLHNISKELELVHLLHPCEPPQWVQTKVSLPLQLCGLKGGPPLSNVAGGWQMRNCWEKVQQEFFPSAGPQHFQNASGRPRHFQCSTLLSWPLMECWEVLWFLQLHGLQILF